VWRLDALYYNKHNTLLRRHSMLSLLGVYSNIVLSNGKAVYMYAEVCHTLFLVSPTKLVQALD